MSMAAHNILNYFQKLCRTIHRVGPDIWGLQTRANGPKYFSKKGHLVFCGRLVHFELIWMGIHCTEFVPIDLEILLLLQ